MSLQYHEKGKYESLPHLWAWFLPAPLSLGTRGESLHDASVGRGQTLGSSSGSAAHSFVKASYMPPRRRRSSPGRSAYSPPPLSLRPPPDTLLCNSLVHRYASAQAKVVAPAHGLALSSLRSAAGSVFYCRQVTLGA